MSERVPEIDAALDRLVPSFGDVPGDWESVLREARPRRTSLTLVFATASLIVLFGVVPALGLGRDVFWLGLYNGEPELIELISGNSYSVGPWRVGVSGGGGGTIGLDLVYGGERRVYAGGVDAGLPGGVATGPRHWVGYVTFSSSEPDAQFAFGPAATRVDRVDILLADGQTFRAKIVPPPPEIRTTLRFYAAELPPTTSVSSVVAYDAAGTILEERVIPRQRS